jgi:hypothetical protein
VIEFRELGKMRGTYIEGFKPHADGRVHTTFTFDTGIGQLSSEILTSRILLSTASWPRPSGRFRCAGHVLTEWDFKSYHVLTTGYEAEDFNYIRCARIDMHSL